MIFITVGTHEQQFNRLIEKINMLKRDNIIQDDIVIQAGYSDYIADACVFKKIMSFEEMKNYIQKARIIITHGGPGSIFAVLNQGKVPIVVPRNPTYGEHVDSHQIKFVKRLTNENKVIGIFDINEMQQSIEGYEKIVSDLIDTNGATLTNDFVEKFSRVINDIFD